MKHHRILVLFLFGAILCPRDGWSQQESVHIFEVFTQAANPDLRDKRILVRNKLIVSDIFDDVSYFLSSNMDSLRLVLDESGRIWLPNAIIFNDCTFTDEIALSGLKMTDLTIENSRAHRINIQNSELNKVTVRNSELENITLDQSQIVDIQIDGNTLVDIQIYGIHLSGGVNLGDNHLIEMHIQNSVFQLSNWFNIYSLEESVGAFDLRLESNVFSGTGTATVKLNADFHNLFIRKDTFDLNLFFESSKVSERFVMANNAIGKQVYFDYLLFSEIRNELYWSQFAGGKIGYAELSIPFAADSLIKYEDHVRFRNLISIYKNLHNIFSLRGDLESANDCYNEMKELEGKWLEQQYEKTSSFASYFRWKLNRLLKFYTNHGTDPALAVVISCYVILAFAVLYMFFPSEWDEDDGRKFISGLKNLRKKNKPYYVQVVLNGTMIVVNAITLSLNSFVTLGFGKIPTKGLARYLCIMEGFVGWFLLSIFTVALINQVLA